MEVKDVTKAGVQVLSLSPQGNAQDKNQTLAENLIDSTDVDSQDLVQISYKAKKESQSEVVAKLNDSIAKLNVAVQSTEQIGKLFNGIEGLVEQAEVAPQEQLALLETEAQKLVEAISGVALKKGDRGQKALAGEAIEFQVEASIGKTLSILLPDDATRAFGLTGVSFTPAENILATRQAVARARAQFEALQSHVHNAVETVRFTLNSADVALQNKESSKTTVRALQSAIELTTSTKEDIEKDPSTAIESIGSVAGDTLR